MQEVTDVEAERLASSFRPNRKPLIIAVIANAVLALSLLGIPYLRGRAQASQARRDFAELSRCLMGGEIAKHPGLSLPQGDRDHFAAQVMHAGPNWPRSCRPALQRLAPEPAIFLWPSVKQAGADLRATVELAERELTALDERRRAGLRRVPERTLQALRRVQAATVLLARAGGVEAELDNDAIAWTGPAQLAVPARLPLMASDDATLDLYSTGTALEALALDSRGVSYLRVADGKVDRERVRRTSFVRGALRNGEEAYIVWAMPEERCKEREDHCAGRPTGLAPYDKGAAALKDPKWKLGGHPSGRLDRVLALSTDRASLLARAAAEGGTALLRFSLEPPLVPAAPDAKPETLEPIERFEVSSASPTADGTIVPGTEPPAVLTIQGDPATPSALAVSLVFADAARARVQLPAVTGDAPWTLGCGSATAQTLAYGTSSQLRVVRVELEAGTDVVTELLAYDAKLPGALDAEDPARDRVRLLCDGAKPQLFFIDVERGVWTSACAADSCSAPKRVASQASHFAVVRTYGGVVLALGSPAEEIRILRLDERSDPAAPAYAPSACFEPASGLCGRPSLVADPQRIILVARDRSDLLALESTDGGATFGTLSGLAGAGTIEQSKTAPLQQHRKRKGID